LVSGKSEGVGDKMLMRALAIVFAVAGVVSGFWPGTISGLLFHTVTVTAREGRIIGALFIVGAAILWFIRPPDHK
jgi:uncharacterized protein YjeT (DUF2065 family)